MNLATTGLKLADLRLQVARQTCFCGPPLSFQYKKLHFLTKIIVQGLKVLKFVQIQVSSPKLRQAELYML